MHFQRERLETALDDMLPLLNAHWREIAHYQDINLDPDIEVYLKVEGVGQLRVFTARDDNKQLLGYSLFFVRHNIHYRQSLQATQDIIYIDKEKRGFGSEFIEWCDRQLKEEGVQVVYHHVKQKHNFGILLERQGYELVDLIYAKRLDQERQT